VTIPAAPTQGKVSLLIRAHLEDGEVCTKLLGEIEVTGEVPSAPVRRDDGLIAICMATFDPDINLLRTQLSSIRAQTDRNWVCLISDDNSSREHYAEIEGATAGDPRFVLSRSPQQAGFYRNFERALKMVPPEADLIALCDQDDRWYPEKLDTLRQALGDAQLVYSDTRLVDTGGRVVRESLWQGRHPNHTNFGSLLISNTIGGSASLFRRGVMEAALPFPEGPGWEFHDHWLGLVAIACGGIKYLNAPLFDYVQHRGAITGQVAVEDSPSPRRNRRIRDRLQIFTRWRAVYFGSYIHLVTQANALLARCGDQLRPEQRATVRRLVAAERRLLPLVWLATRSQRPLIGRNETMGTEWSLIKGILWRRLLPLRIGRRQRPGGARFDASLPQFDPLITENRRLRRWRAGR
jgi:glycosyltransferase involved in cell wall biosynthesis